MRILSQDGMCDYPYDEIGLSIGWRGDKEEYYIHWNCIQQKMCAKIATYSSLEKAQRAMEMLHNWYFANATAERLVFQFPADNELED